MTWTNAGVSGSGLQVFAQQFNKLGEKKEGEFAVNTTTAGDQKNASVAINLLGQAIVVWSGQGAADTNGVYFQRYRTDLHPFEPNGHDQDHPEASIAIASPGRQVHALRQNADLDSGSGAVLERRQIILETSQQPRESAPQFVIESSAHASSRHHEAGLPELHELPTTIDKLFGSEAWLNGRYYRAR